MTNGRFEGFDPDKRIEVKFEEMEWLVLDELMEKAAALDSEVKLAQTSKESKNFGKRETRVRRGETKMKDPW